MTPAFELVWHHIWTDDHFLVLYLYLLVFCRNNVPIVLEEEDEEIEEEKEEERKRMMIKEENGQIKSELIDGNVAVWPRELNLLYLIGRNFVNGKFRR